MAADHDVELNEDPELGNGDRLSDRLDDLDLESADSSSTDEMRDLLDL
ncbi:hypothetical protein HUG10_20805 (plasmid) [Halorarum halophilum]|uniref:Uncharacterized protein n=1 Tax=Halorarum halophilum TaxID=2743090 RepID=A0A7D5GET1_9EURY|nr:hypothetical protein [Halobaculum halophilum]QLG30045.1 hypothetical protein HUG10_20805 [Halobaculum halophilum]